LQSKGVIHVSYAEAIYIGETIELQVQHGYTPNQREQALVVLTRSLRAADPILDKSTGHT